MSNCFTVARPTKERFMAYEITVENMNEIVDQIYEIGYKLRLVPLNHGEGCRVEPFKPGQQTRTGRILVGSYIVFEGEDVHIFYTMDELLKKFTRAR